VAAARRRRARGKRGRGQGKRGAEVGEVEGDAWERNAAGGGAREAAPAVGGGGRSRAEAKQWCQRRKKADRVRRTDLQI
jgi:hypothetical protein